MGYASGILAIYFQEETYGPVILVSKAAELRRLTRNWGIHAKQVCGPWRADATKLWIALILPDMCPY